MSGLTAVVICPSGDEGGNLHRRLLGLSVGQRLLLALGHGGVTRVVFAGKGDRPDVEGAPLKSTRSSRLKPEELGPGFLVLPADLVFDRALLASPQELSDDLPVRYVRAEEFEDVITKPNDWLRRLGPGRAVGGQGFALRVTDAVAARSAERSLLLNLRKPLDGLVSRYLNRHLSLLCSRWLVRTGIRPNQLTVVIMALGALGALLAALAEPWWVLVLAGLLFQAQSVFDGCDGEIARLTYRFSRLGQWLDTIGDDLTNYSFCLGLAVGQARLTGWSWLYAVAGATLVIQCLSTGIMYRRMIRMGTGDLLQVPVVIASAPVAGRGFGVLKVLHALSKRDVFVLVISLLTIFQLPLVGFALMAAGTYPVFFGVWLNDRKLSRQAQRGPTDRSQSAAARPDAPRIRHT